MPRFAANLTMMFGEVPFADRFEAAADAGFAAVECLFPYPIPAARLSDTLRRLGLEQAMFNLHPGDWDAGERGVACLPGRFSEVRSSVDLGLEYANASGARRLHLMAGMADARDPEAAAAYRRSVEYAADRLAAEGIELLLEPINARSMPGYFLNDFATAETLISELGRPNVRLQFDVFHRQIMHGDVTTAFRRLLPAIGHVQVASVPSRHEPRGEELNYDYVLRSIDDAGYLGFVGCEYVPRTTTLEGLSWLDPYRGRS